MNVPKLRFKEFTDEWTHCFLSDIAVIQSGLTPSRKIKEYYINGIIPWIKTTDLNNSYITKIEEKISKKALDETSIKIFPKNTLLLAMYGGYNQIGRTGLSTTEITTNQALSAILFKNANMNSYFFLNLLNKYKDYWKIVSASSRKDPNITKKDIERFPITYPTLKEQNKIAKFLSTVDKKISNLEDIITTLEKQKKGLLQQIFSQKIRFKDKNGNNYPDWEKKKLGDICTIIGGGTPDSSNNEYWNGNINWFTPSEIGQNKYVSESKKKISKKGLDKSSARLLPIGTILLSSRATIGEKSILLSPATTNQGFQSLVINELTSNEYIFYYLDILKRNMIKYSSGSTFLEISKTQIKNLNITLPCLEEQTKIADFLSAFDRKIDNQKAQLEHWKQIKKGLLQQMFV